MVTMTTTRGSTSERSPRMTVRTQQPRMTEDVHWDGMLSCLVPPHRGIATVRNQGKERAVLNRCVRDIRVAVVGRRHIPTPAPRREIPGGRRPGRTDSSRQRFVPFEIIEGGGEVRGGHRAGVDALRCSTTGSLRHKRTLSFDLSRVSLTLAMRRLIFEGEDRAADARIGPTTAHPPPSAAAATGESHPPCHRPDHAQRRRRRIRCPDRPVARP